METNKPDIQIPLQAALSTLILKDIDAEITRNPEKTLRQFFSERHRLQEFQIINSGYIMMLSYALIVIPVANKSCLSIDYDKLTSLDKLIIKNAKYQRKSNGRKLKHLRNSISHVRFNIDYSKGLIEFRDCEWVKDKEDPKKGEYKENFLAFIQDRDFYELIDQYFRLYCEAYDKKFGTKITK